MTLQPAFGQTSQVFVDSDSDGLSDKYERGVGRYELVSGSFTWQEAKSDAEARGGHLATITIDQEWFSISNLLGSALAGKAPWLGGSDSDMEGAWRWINGEPWGYTRWGIGEPNNRGDEDFLQIIGDGTWNDIPPTGQLPGFYLFERGFYTDPNNADTDGDGVGDGAEIGSGTLPNDPTSKPVGPNIIIQPQDVEIKSGATATFSIQATGTGPIRYQWRLNGARIVGGTSANLILTDISAQDEGQYTVQVTDDKGTASSKPVNLILFRDSDGDGLSDNFERGVGRYELIRDGFTWELAKSDAEKRGGHLATIVSQAEWDSIIALMGNFYEGKSVFIGGTDAVKEGTWEWVTGERWGFTRWAATEPNNSGDEDYLHINASGLWNDHNTQHNLAHYLFERGFYTDPNNADSDGDGYPDGVEYEAGSIPTDPGSRPLPRITAQPQATNVTAGSSFTLAVTADGYGALNFQWRVGGEPINGAINATLTVSNAQHADAGRYDVVLRNAAGSVTSAPAIVKVTPLLEMERLNNGFVILQLLDIRPLAWRVEASEDIKSWQSLGSMNFTNGLGVFFDAASAGKLRRFYRVLAP